MLEWEFEAATRAGLTRLVFLVADDATGLPREVMFDGEFDENSIQRLGDIRPGTRGSRPGRPRGRYDTALGLYERIEEPYSIGMTNRRLARLNNGLLKCERRLSNSCGQNDADKPWAAGSPGDIRRHFRRPGVPSLVVGGGLVRGG